MSGQQWPSHDSSGLPHGRGPVSTASAPGADQEATGTGGPVQDAGASRRVAISVRELSHTYSTASREVLAVDRVSFQVREGTFFTLLGPSGCGKTTTLHCIAGLERPAVGEIELGGTVVVSRSRYVPAYRRDIGMVFQDYAVWPHMTVYENVAFPLRAAGQGRGSRARERVMNMLSIMGMADLAHRRPTELSGGQQQRVSLARALVREPSVLLLDEPLSNLDATLREQMRTELRQIQRRLRVTTLFVTHDQFEALSMSNRVAVMRDGRIVQEGSPREVYCEPTNTFVASSVGTSSFVPGRVSASGADDPDELTWVHTDIGDIRCRTSPGIGPGQEVVVVVRPEGIRLHPLEEPQRENLFPGVVGLRLYLGDSLDYRVDLGGQELRARRPPSEPFRNKEKVMVELPAQECVAIPRDG